MCRLPAKTWNGRIPRSSSRYAMERLIPVAPPRLERTPDLLRKRFELGRGEAVQKSMCE